MSRIGRSVLEPWEQESALTMQGALEGGEASVFFFFFWLLHFQEVRTVKDLGVLWSSGPSLTWGLTVIL